MDLQVSRFRVFSFVIFVPPVSHSRGALMRVQNTNHEWQQQQHNPPDLASLEKKWLVGGFFFNILLCVVLRSVVFLCLFNVCYCY